MKKISASGCMSDRIKYGKEVVALSYLKGNPDTINEFFTLIVSAPMMLTILREINNKGMTQQLQNKIACLVQDLEGFDET